MKTKLHRCKPNDIVEIIMYDSVHYSNGTRGDILQATVWGKVEKIDNKQIIILFAEGNGSDFEERMAIPLGTIESITIFKNGKNEFKKE